MKSSKKYINFFNEKVVVITGSSRGIGKATAIMLCSYGARLIMNGRNKDVLDKCVKEIQELNYSVEGVNCDISTPEGSSFLISEAIRHFGRIDILINNAGMSMRGNVDELDPVVFEKVFDTNYYGSVYPVIYALPFIKKTEGSVVFISSVAGIRGIPGLSAYCSAKMALRAIAESLRIELKEYNVHTGLIYVGYASNDTGKMVMASDGSLKPIEERQGVKTLSQTQIASVILDNIYRRKFIKVLSGLGKLNSIMQRISPSFVEWVLIRNMKKIDSMSK